MCEAIVKGVRTWINGKEDLQRRQILDFSRTDLCEPFESKTIEGGGYQLDDLKGYHLEQALAKKARGEEMQAFKERIIYEPVPISSIPDRDRPGSECCLSEFDGLKPTRVQHWLPK